MEIQKMEIQCKVIGNEEKGDPIPILISFKILLTNSLCKAFKFEHLRD